VDLAKLAGHGEAGVLGEIRNEDGTMARLPQRRKIADQYNMRLVPTKDLIHYRLEKDSPINEEIRIKLPTKYGIFELIAFAQTNTHELHLALKKGDWKEGEPVMVRVHSSCLTGDILGSLRCDCGDQLHRAMEMIEREGKGLV